MLKNKYDFIAEILENKKLTTAQRERVLFLTKEEIKNDGLIGEDLEERVKKLEEIVKGDAIESTRKEHGYDLKNESKQTVIKLDKYFEPSSLYRYLFDYNQNQILKSTCHEIDSNELENILNYCGTEKYDFEKHFEKIIEAFLEHDKKFAPGKVKHLIRGYLTGKNHLEEPIEGSHKFSTLNWSSTELKNWCQQNKGVPPNIDEGLMEQIEKTGYELTSPFLLKDGNYASTFSDLVIYFKRLFHIRKDNSLKSLILRENESKGWNNRIEFTLDDEDFPNNIEIFTDVQKLIEAYNIIIKLTLEQKINQDEKVHVKLSLTEKGNSIEFSILHKKSVYGKTIKNSTEGRLGDKYSGLIKFQINGICNFYVQADFENKESFRIGIWNKPNLWVTENPKPIKLPYKVGGVEHIFEIVKPKL
jgi:hypothetical protein